MTKNKLKCPWCKTELVGEDVLGIGKPIFTCPNKACQTTLYLLGTEEMWNLLKARTEESERYFENWRKSAWKVLKIKKLVGEED